MSYKLFPPQPLLSVPLCIISLPLLWHSTPSPMPRPPYVVILFQVCAALVPHPHIPETDLLLLSAWTGHIHFAQLIPIPLGTGDGPS